MNTAGSGIFFYQGDIIQLPGSIFDDNQIPQHVSNFKDIFCCNGHNCKLCEDCLIKNFYEGPVGSGERSKTDRDSANSTTREDTEKDVLEAPLGEEKYMTTENILLSILWSSIKQAELIAQRARHNKITRETINHEKTMGTELNGGLKRKNCGIYERSIINTSDLVNMQPRKKAKVKETIAPILQNNKTSNDSAKPYHTEHLDTAAHQDSSKISHSTFNVLPERENDTGDNGIGKSGKDTQSVNMTSNRGKVSCYGKIKNQTWGCNCSFDSLELLKQHWCDRSSGAQCLRRFIELRKS